MDQSDFLSLCGSVLNSLYYRLTRYIYTFLLIHIQLGFIVRINMLNIKSSLFLVGWLAG